MNEPIEKPQAGKEEEDSHFAQIKSLAKEAYRFLDSRQWDKAESKLKELLAKEPSNTYGLVGMGDLHFKRRNSGKLWIFITDVSKKIHPISFP